MPWHDPITWTPAQTVDDAELNEQIRDNMLVLKTRIDDDGTHRTLFHGSSDIVGNVDAGETVLHTFPLPAYTLKAPGQGLRILTVGELANNVNLKTIRFYVGNLAINNLISSNAPLANNIFLLDVAFSYTNWVFARCWAQTSFDAASGASPSREHFFTTVAPPDFRAGVTIKFTGLATTTDDIKMYGIQVEPIR